MKENHSDNTPKKWNAWRDSAFRKRDRPEIYKNNNPCKRISEKTLMKILGQHSPKLDSVTHLANMLSYIILKSESPIVLKKGVETIDKLITKNTNVWYSEQLLYWFQKAYPKKVEYTLNKWLRRIDLKQPTDGKYQNAMLYIKWYINNRIKNWEKAENISENECMTVFT